MPEYCEIKIKDHLDPHWSDWFAGLELVHLEGGETLLAGQLPDQVALHGILDRIRHLNLVLISVTCGGPAAPYPKSEQKGEDDEDSARRA